MKIDKAILKTVTYRTLSVLFSMGVVFIFTGNFFASAGTGLAEIFGGSLLYYVHEKVWGLVDKNEN
jgi:uncharacterized membrane protein